MSERLRHLLPKVLAAGILVNLLLLLGCGGTAGIENGQIIGKVYSNLRAGVAARNLEPGVSVVAEGQSTSGNLKILRTTTTDSNGVFQFAGLPVGEYVLGFAKDGFITITTGEGVTTQSTPTGNQVRVSVEPGKTAVAADVTMIAAHPYGNFTLIVTLLDGASGLPVTDGTVTVNNGGGSQTENADGVYTLSVPIIPYRNYPYGFGRTYYVQAFADGYNRYSYSTLYGDNYFYIYDPIPGQTYRYTIRLQPLTSGAIEGSYRFSAYQNAYRNLTPSVRIKDFDPRYSFNTNVNSSLGTWRISEVPPSTASITRQYDIVFSHPNIKTYTLPKVVMPKDGAKTIANPVVLEPITVDVIGQVLVQPSGQTAGTVQQSVPNGADDYVMIVETGQRASIINGSFLISKVPVQQDQDYFTVSGGYTFKVMATDPSTKLKWCKTTTGFRPVSDGTTNPVYNMGTIFATQDCSQDTGL